MNKVLKRVLIGVIFFFGVFLSVSLAIDRDKYPRPVDNYVNDFAGIINMRDSDEIRRIFGLLYRQTGIMAAVVTVNSVSDYATGDDSIESFSKNLFNIWGIGQRGKNNGILILVSNKDRKCRLLLGAGYGKGYDLVLKQIIDERMIPHFQKGDISRGVYEGSLAVIEKFSTTKPRFSSFKLILIIGIMAVVFISVVVLVMHYGRRTEKKEHL